MDIKSRSEKALQQPLWAHICEQLHAIAREVAEAEQKENKHICLRIMNECAIRARELIELLIDCQDIPLDQRGSVEIALRSMANVLIDYEDDWLQAVLDDIYFKA
jgi:hypothetical protein